MRILTVAASVLVICSQCFAAPQPTPQAKVRTVKIPVHPRTIASLPNFPLAHLKTSLSGRLYKSLCVSPLEAWVAVHIPPYGGTPKIIHSEAGGAYDNLALSMAKEWGSADYNTTESRTHAPSLNVHLLIFKIADGINGGELFSQRRFLQCRSSVFGRVGWDPEGWKMDTGRRDQTERAEGHHPLNSRA